MKLKTLLASCALGLMAVSPAMASLDVGDSVQVQYWFPGPGDVYQDSGVFTFTGDGQAVDTQYGITTLYLYSDHVVFDDHCGPGCTQTNGSWNGAVLFDLTDAGAFNGWGVTASSIAYTSFSNTGNMIGVNWQGADANGSVTVSAVPEPSSALLMMLGLGVAGGIARRRKA